jgi:hypothetical protein
MGCFIEHKYLFQIFNLFAYDAHWVSQEKKKRKKVGVCFEKWMPTPQFFKTPPK